MLPVVSMTVSITTSAREMLRLRLRLRSAGRSQHFLHSFFVKTYLNFSRSNSISTAGEIFSYRMWYAADVMGMGTISLRFSS